MSVRNGFKPTAAPNRLGNLQLMVRVVLTALASVTGAQAASINLVQSEPDVGFSGGIVTYVAPTCAKSAGTGGAATAICGTTSGQGPNSRVYNGALATAGKLTISDPNNVGGNSAAMFYNDTQAGGTNSNTGFFGDFILNAYFNADGNFVSALTVGATTYTSSLSLIMTSGTINNVGSAPPNFPIVAANITRFGFSGTGSAVLLEFEGAPTGGYWDTNTVSNLSGTIANTTLSDGAPSSGTSWELDANNDGDIDQFKKNWSGTAAVDTFVPVPAAIWLFGSGLLALGGLARRKTAAQI